MKTQFFSWLFAVVVILAFESTAIAQYDDLYFDPATDYSLIYGTTASANPAPKQDDSAYRKDYRQDLNRDEGYEDDYDDDYDYYYTSRIRRFHRPFFGFDYYDPCYVDMYYYDPFFFSPGVTIMIYDDPWSYREWRRRNRWNNWNRWNSWSYNPWNGWNSWNHWDPWHWGGYGQVTIINNYYGNGWYGWGNPYNDWGGNYCPPTWGHGYTYDNPSNNVYYGARKSGGIKTGGGQVRSPRLTGDNNDPEKGVNPTKGDKVKRDPAVIDRNNPRDLQPTEIEGGNKPTENPVRGGLDDVKQPNSTRKPVRGGIDPTDGNKPSEPRTPSRGETPADEIRQPTTREPVRSRDEMMESKPERREMETPRPQPNNRPSEEPRPQPDVKRRGGENAQESMPERSRMIEQPSRPPRDRDADVRTQPRSPERQETPSRPSRNWDNDNQPSRNSTPTYRNNGDSNRSQSRPSGGSDSGRSGGSQGSGSSSRSDSGSKPSPRGRN